MAVRKSKPLTVTPNYPSLDTYFQNNEIFKNAFQYSAIGVSLASLEGKWLKVNQKVCEIIGYSEEELLKLTFQDITHPEDLDADLNYIQQALAGEIETYNMEKRYFHKNGQIVWVLLSVSIARDNNQEPLFFISQIEDITERKLASEKLAESEKRYRSLFDNSPISLWEDDYSAVKQKLDALKQNGVTDFSDYFMKHPEVIRELSSLIKIIDTNKYSIKLFNAKNKAELLDYARNSLTHGFINHQEFINIANGMTHFEWEGINRKINGELLNIRLTWSVALGYEQTLSKVIISIVDITESKQAEEERQILINELDERVKELTYLHNISRIFMDDTRTEFEVLQAVADAIPSAWQYPEITAARVGYNGYQFTTPNFKQTDWMLSQFFELPNGLLGVVQVAYLEERPEAYQGPFVIGEIQLVESTVEKLRTYIKGILADQAMTRQLTELETLYESGLKISQLLTPTEIAQEVIEVLERRMNWHHIAIREYDQESQSVKLIGFNKPNINKGEAQEYIQKINRLISNPSQGLSGWVTTSGKSLRVSNVNMDERFVPTFADINSGLYVPLKIGERVIGSISVESEIENGFSENDERLLVTLAGQAAIAIENANLFNELEKRVQERTVQIEATKRRLELATHAGQIGVWEYIPREKKAIWDERMHIIHHVAIGEFDGTTQSWAKHIHPEDLAKSQMNSELAFTENLLINNEHRIIWQDGSIHYLATSAVTVFTEENMPDRVIGISIDITDRKKSEETLKLANAEMENALKVKDEFLANMSHELRTPLNAILGISESLEEQFIGQLNDKQLKYVGVVKESGKHLLELINDILDISKIEAGRMELTFHPISVEKLCQASLRMIKELAQKKNIKVSFKVKGEVNTIMGDERRLKQVLVNLLSNAVKFTEEGKQVGLEVVGYPANNEVTFSVWDTGIGIAQEDVKFLFKPFVQLDAGLAREYQGTGLGLALVAQMVRLHGGLVSTSSQPDKGSRFTITLPWQPEEQNTPVKVTAELVLPNQKSEEKRKGTVLLVEDTNVIVSLIKDYLTFKGYEVIVANNGRDGILLAKEKLPDIILMDVMMPIMDGVEATKQIRAEKKLKQTPIIALTALAMHGDRERCLEAGMNDYMSKPVKLNELIEIIEKHIAQG
jgi:PAS domain S-box-containing protein